MTYFSPPHNDLARTVLSVLAIGLLLVATVWIMKPFILALVWATMIVVATWPMLLGAQARLRNSRALAVLVMTVGMLLVLILPLIMAVATVFQHIDKIKEWVRNLSTSGLPALPDWIGSLPLVGGLIAEKWLEAAAAGPEGLSAQIALYTQKGLTWFVSNAGNMGMIAVQLLITLILTAVLYAQGETAAEGVKRFFRRLSGPRGEETVILAGKAIRAVAMGIVVTALIQSAMGGIGLWIAGVPAAGLLTAVMFLFAIAQVGVVPVMLAAVGWLYYKKLTFWAIALLVWTVVVGSLDNVIRPILIKRGADLPLLLILAGVLGGLVAFGVIGLFVGPVVLAVSYTLVKAWVNDSGEERDEFLPSDS
jgi:predicted PurR-regulated permease PerM